MNVGVWLNEERAAVFRRHVPKGEASSYGAAAIEEKLRREGAYDSGNREAAAFMRSVSPAALPLLVEFAEVLAVRPAEATAALETLKGAALEAAGSDGR